MYRTLLLYFEKHTRAKIVRLWQRLLSGLTAQRISLDELNNALQSYFDTP